MINVLFIGMTSNPGGLETYMINIFSRLEGHGFHFTFLNIRNTDVAYSNFIKQRGGTIKKVVTEGIRFKHLRRMHKAEMFFKKHHNYDIVHLNTTYLNQIYWIKAARRYNVRHLIIQSHNCGYVFNSKILHILSMVLDKYNKVYLKNHSDIIKWAASYDCGKWMFGRNSNFHVINNGINTESYIYNPKYKNLLKKKLGLKPSTKIIITTARVDPQKNYTKIINVYKWVHHYDKNIKLVIIGVGKSMNIIKNMVNIYHLDKDVYFLGEMNKYEVAKYLNIGDLMVMPSLYEAIPFSLTEAQAAGIPAVVSSNISKIANVTNCVKYISLNKTDKYWSHIILSMLSKYKYLDRYKMNKMVKQSKFSLDYSINQIRTMYLRITNN